MNWAKVSGTPTDFADLEVSDGHPLGMVTSCSARGSCTGPSDLMERPVSGGTFRKVTAATGYNLAAVLDGSRFFVTRNGGTTITGGQTPCGTYVDGAAGLAVTGPDNLAVLCVGDAATDGTSKTAYTSSDLGSHWTKDGSPSHAGLGGLMAGSASKLTVASTGLGDEDAGIPGAADKVDSDGQRAIGPRSKTTTAPSVSSSGRLTAIR